MFARAAVAFALAASVKAGGRLKKSTGQSKDIRDPDDKLLVRAESIVQFLGLPHY